MPMLNILARAIPEEARETGPPPQPDADGNMKILRIDHTYFFPVGSLEYEAHATSASPQRWLCVWEGYPESADFTWEPIEHLYKAPNGSYPQIEKFQATLNACQLDHNRYIAEEATATVLTTKLIVRELTRHADVAYAGKRGTGDINWTFASSKRHIRVPCEAKRFQWLFPETPAHALKINKNKLTFAVGGDFIAYLSKCVLFPSPFHTPHSHA